MNRIYNPVALVGVVSLLFTMSGCNDIVPSEYGSRSSYPGTSLNGTRVLADMFHRAGHSVRSWRYLSPALENADVIVWFPDDFDAPQADVEEWLNYWLVEGDPNSDPRVLVIVGRDFDAAPDYWTRMQGNAPKGLNKEYKRRLAEAKTDAVSNRPARLSRSDTDRWFSLDETKKQQTITKLSGPWAEGIDVSKADIIRHTRMIPHSGDFKTLLADGNGDEIVSERSIDEYGYYGAPVSGRVIMVENGSWLLNARLVNHEHRKLAGRLIDAVGTPKRRIVFLESYDGGPPIRAEDPNTQPPTGFELFRVWPIGAVLTQLAALGIVFAMMKWPIFGIPRRVVDDNSSEFSSHVTALGRLLAGGRSRSFAISLIKMYRQALRRDHAPVTEITHSGSPLPAPSSDPSTLE